MSKHFLQLAMCITLIATAGVVEAAPITYSVTVNTTSLAGTTGFLDFDFAPGSDSQSATVSISGFSTDGLLSGLAQVNGAVTGNLPGSLSITNTTQFNDYFQGLNFGTSIFFTLTLSGPALSTPNGTSTSGSTFAFGMFDATGSNPLLTSDPNGNTFTVQVNLIGTTSVTTFPPANGGNPAATVVTAESTVPEPSTLMLVTITALSLIAVRRVSRHSCVM